MTRLFRAPEALDDLPPRAPVLAPNLRLAPELAVLAVIDDALRTALLALLAEHPTLDDRDVSREPHTLRRARRLVRSMLALRDVLDDYRRAVISDVGTSNPVDDPF